jgi:hypothetical protein
MAERYILKNDTPRCFSGDDSLFYAVLQERPSWKLIANYFTLEGKTAVTRVPEFCGWYLYPCGAVRNPVLLALKIKFREARGELDRTLDSYFLESQIAHRAGDALFDHLPPLALEAQRWVTDFCFARPHLIPHLSSKEDIRRHAHLPITHIPAATLLALSLSSE